MPRLYAVGDRKSGVLFVRTEPFRAVMVDDQAIDSYAKTVGKDYDTVFGEIAGWATGFVAEIADGDNWDAKRNFVDTQRAAGTPTEADFCFVTDIADGDDWDAKRNFVDIQPIARALDAIVPRSGGAFPRDLPHTDLEGFVSRDMA
jgi:hypothetical protein